MTPKDDAKPRPLSVTEDTVDGRPYRFEVWPGEHAGNPRVYARRDGGGYLNCERELPTRDGASYAPTVADARRLAEQYERRKPARKTMQYSPVFPDRPRPTHPEKAFTAEIPGAGYRQENVLAPAGWSQLAVNVVASKYFHGDASKGDNPEQGGRESSVFQLVGRVAGQLEAWAVKDGCLSWGDGRRFWGDLFDLCLGQYGSFNSPVWFNVGLSRTYGLKGGASNYVWSAADGKAVPCRDTYEHPQGSACFIQSVKDDMGSIMDLARSEAMLFKHGSGTGTDLSTLRSTREKLRSGGKPSGPVSFLRIYDKVAGQIKSGGTVRRAARMNTLRDWHPDVLAFANAKSTEDRKARALIAAGYSDKMTGHEDEAYSSVDFQNTNLSVRLSDAYMWGLNPGGIEEPWPLRAVTSGEIVERILRSSLMNAIATGTWLCGDPGVQYEDTIQRWHTCPNSGSINSSNPCAEFVFLDDSACNLASLNLLKFLRDDDTFDIEMFRRAVRTFLIAQDVLVDRASYPTAAVAENSHRFRPLGLGYANLGALLMALGLPYDSKDGRNLAASITSLMHAEALLTSADMAHYLGAFDGFAENREPMLAVVDMHCEHANDLYTGIVAGTEAFRIAKAAVDVMDAARAIGANFGFRNAQVTLLAPTGTIGFMMDCDTTGVEPCIGLVAYKQLAGGGSLKLVNGGVERALRKLGYEEDRIRRILAHVEKHDTIEGCEDVMAEHLPVFDCAFPSRPGGRSIAWQGHLRMMGAVQPFLSGAISKTVNMPESATVADIRDAYVMGWKLGLKAVAVYRDNSKGVQPVSTRKADGKKADETAALLSESFVPPDDDPETWTVGGVPVDPGAVIKDYDGEPVGSISGLLTEAHGDGAAERVDQAYARGVADGRKAATPGPQRHRLPDTRQAVTHKFSVGGHEGYLNVGLFPDGRPGELFVTMSKEGSTIGGLMDVVGTAIAIGLQYGVPLEVFVDKFSRGRFEPSGSTANRDIPFASSLTDYVFRWLAMEFVPGYREANAPQRGQATETVPPPVPPVLPTPAVNLEAFFRPDPVPPELTRSRPADGFAAATNDTEICPSCGGLAYRRGKCHTCQTCGTSLGCS